MSETLSSATVEELKGFGSATVHEASGGCGAIDSAIMPIDTGMQVVGRALTVDLEAGDNWFIHVALLDAQPGDVLVVDAKGYTKAGPWGDVLTTAAQAIGLSGLVIDGSVRDTQAIVDAGFPVFSRGVCIRGTSKNREGHINGTVEIGGVSISSGDVIVGDRDGVCVVASHRLAEVLESSRNREIKEEEMRKRIAKGDTTLSILGLIDPRVQNTTSEN